MSGITRYIFRQVATGTVVVSLALVFVVWLTQSLQFLQFIINKGLAISTWLKLTMLLLPWFLSVILPAALFLVTLFVYNKLAADRELVVAQAAGVSRFGLAEPALLGAAATVIIGYALTLFIVPGSFQSFQDLQWAIRSDVSQIMLREGAFNQVTPGMTVYVRGRGPDGELRGVLVHDEREKTSSMTLMAERGVVSHGESGPRVLLFNGSRQSLTPGTGDFAVLYFDTYTLDFGTVQSAPADRYENNRERSTWDLLTVKEADGVAARNVARMRAEGHQRLVGPLNALGFTLVALAFLLTGTFERRGQIRRILAAIGAIVGLQAAALGAMNLAGKAPVFITLMYAVALLPIAAGLYIILAPGRRGPQHPLPLNARTA
jgi:lipopolysaccharide export system permease protein